jgi:homoserine dehydrogenase
LHSGRVDAYVRLERINEFHPLANFGSEWNALSISLATGESTVVSGRGAGRWPTTEAIIADLFELRRELQLKSAKESTATPP